jgi:folate-dependent phosphoribosylglycinamide formyltransferase PurN
MRVIMLTHGGAELVLEKLAELDNVEVVGVFVETATTPRRGIVEKIRRSIKYDGVLGTAKKLFPKRDGVVDVSAAGNRTIEIAEKLGLSVYEVENFHSETAIAMMRKTNADLGIIYGTNIIKERVFSIPKLGSINLHQGLAPHYRGGPPIFWELFNGEKEVGITAHFVVAKVDTGDIIHQKTVPLDYDFAYGTAFEEFITSFQLGLREESANLVAESVKLIASGDVQRKPQDISIGKRYRLPVKREKDEMRRRLRQRMNRGENAEG